MEVVGFPRLPEAETVRLVRAAVLAREGKAGAAGELLAGGAGAGCALMRAQLAAAAGDAQQVLSRLTWDLFGPDDPIHLHSTLCWPCQGSPQ